jgi:DinB superfamily
MKRLNWFERKFTFGLPVGMLPFYLERLEGTIARMESKLYNVSDEILSSKPDGKWSVKQNIGHLAEVDEITSKRIDEIRNGAATLSPAVFEPKDYNPMPIGDVLKYFNRTRKHNLLKYKTISETDLTKSALHPRLNVPMTPVDLAWFDAEHDDHHMVRVNEIISILSKTSLL